MAQIILAGDGLTIETPDEIAKSDELLKRALAPHYPDLANALITREEKDSVLRVTISKRAGPKGCQAGLVSSSAETPTNRVVQVLDNAAEYLNPALALAWQLLGTEAFGENEEQCLTLEKQLSLQGVISEAILEGENQVALVEKALELLKAAPASPSRYLPKGF